MDRLVKEKKNILVTGATGFIGKNLIKKLKESNVHIIIVVRNEEKAKKLGDLSDITIITCEFEKIESLSTKLQQLDIISIESVIHLAWEGNSGCSRGDDMVQLKNIQATSRLIREVEKLGCKKFIGIGTVSENLVMESEIRGVSTNMVYAAAKLSCYYMARVLCKEKKIDFVWCRLANVYGPGNETGNLMSYTLKSLLEYQKPTYSSAQVWQDFIFIDDCIEALMRIVFSNNKRDLYYIGTGQPKKLKEYLMIVRDIVSPNIELGIGERPDDGLIYKKEWFDIRGMQEEYDYCPRVTFEEGIKRTIVMEDKRNEEI